MAEHGTAVPERSMTGLSDFFFDWGMLLVRFSVWLMELL